MADVHAYALDLPELPWDDAWYGATAGTGDSQVSIQALDAGGTVLARNAITWVRELFCMRPSAGAP